MAPIQQEFPRSPTPDGPTASEELDELYEDEPRRRSWAAIASVVLALAVIFVGYQWHQAAGREHTLTSQMHALRADAETLRLRGEEAQREIEVLQKRLTAVGAEKATLTDRVAALERVAQERAAAVTRAAERERERTVAAARERARATPVVAKKRL